MSQQADKNGGSARLSSTPGSSPSSPPLFEATRPAPPPPTRAPSSGFGPSLKHMVSTASLSSKSSKSSKNQNNGLPNTKPLPPPPFRPLGSRSISDSSAPPAIVARPRVERNPSLSLRAPAVMGRNPGESLLNPPGRRPPPVLRSRKSSNGTPVVQQAPASAATPGVPDTARLPGIRRYLREERDYLRKMKASFADDYYTKEIAPALNDSEGDQLDLDTDHEEDPEEEGQFLPEIDPDLYELDLKMIYPSSHDRAIAPDDESGVLERLQWQTMLAQVMTGDILKSERGRIAPTEKERLYDDDKAYLQEVYKEIIWSGIRLKIYGRLEEEQKQYVLYARTIADEVISDIMSFKVDLAAADLPMDQITEILDRYDKITEYWGDLTQMRVEKPMCATEEFQDRIDALTAWKNINELLHHEVDLLKEWIGIEEPLGIEDLGTTTATADSAAVNQLITAAVSNPHDSAHDAVSILSTESPPAGGILPGEGSFAERLMKEKDINTVFKRRLVLHLGRWIAKAKFLLLMYGPIFEQLGLPVYLKSVLNVARFPMVLIKEIIKVRLQYARKLRSPTMMMIDQMLGDFKLYVSLALEIREGMSQYAHPQPGWENVDLTVDEDFEQAIMECTNFSLELLGRKLLDSTRLRKLFRTFREPDELAEQWEFFKLIGFRLGKGGALILEQFSVLTNKLMLRLHNYFESQIKGPPALLLSSALLLQPLETASQEVTRWYTTTRVNVGQMKRKSVGFKRLLTDTFRNLALFLLQKGTLRSFLDQLRSTDHFLVRTDHEETNGVYFLALAPLWDRHRDIQTIISAAHLGVGSTRPPRVGQWFAEDPEYAEFQIPEKVKLYDPLEYVLAVCTPQILVWDGQQLEVHLDKAPDVDVKPGRLLVIGPDATNPYREPGTDDLDEQGSPKPLNNRMKLALVRDTFVRQVGDTVGQFLEYRCSVGRVRHELLRLEKTYTRLLYLTLELALLVRQQCMSIHGCQPLVNLLFVFARDNAREYIRTVEVNRRTAFYLRMVQLGVDWVSFVCDDCIRTDRKTFKWCLQALEFAMAMTKGYNILTLLEHQFATLKLKVAGCMLLLILHFDVMGARLLEAQKRSFLKWLLLRNVRDSGPPLMEQVSAARVRALKAIEETRHEALAQQRLVGRVIDDGDLDHDYLTYLALLFLLVQFRWQRNLYIGGGTFGSVYEAVDLDLGTVMAVKEIRFHDLQLVRAIVTLIKDEMTVLEMLNHPNIVQYYGVEVHRDKVCIFMEYCPGGLLAGLLEYGRIEDELVIQVYTLQMLEGLAYLHQLNIIHRDIKPENILLDHNGVIKFVDFGAAKVIAAQGRTRAGASVVGGPHPLNLSSMTGTPMYMLPESIRGTKLGLLGAADIWSLGCCVLEMATGRRPWANLDNEWAVMYHIAAGQKPPMPLADQLSEGGRRVVAKCLEEDPAKRVTAVELLGDPWITLIRMAAFGGESEVSEVSEVSTGSSEVFDIGLA